MSSTTPLSAITPSTPLVAALPPQLLAAHERVAVFTQGIFGRPATVTREHDPDEGFEYFRVRVEAAGSMDELKEKFRRWHHELPTAAGEFADRYALSPALSIAE
jgi:hypothetical protein